jgi:hypothetical protein
MPFEQVVFGLSIIYLFGLSFISMSIPFEMVKEWYGY